MENSVPRYGNLIEGRPVPPSSNRYFRNLDPSDTCRVLGYFPRSQSRDISRAAEAAKAAFKSWRNVPAPKKAELLFEITHRLKENKEDLAQVITEEMGKPLEESRAEVQEVIDTAFYYAGEGRRLEGMTAPSEMPHRICMTLRRPVGVCGLITPWNFPMAVPAWKMFPALILGNTLVWKPAEDAPRSAEVLARLFEETGLPKGVLNVVHGMGPEAGGALVRNPDVSLISFTGSTEVGAKIARECGARLKRYSLEMGGKNAQIIMPDGDFRLALEGALWGAFGTSGQRCTATSRILVHEKIYQKFLKSYTDLVRKLRVGDGRDERTQLGPIINRKQLEKVLRYIQLGKREGARLLTGGKRLTKKGFSRGFYIEPTVFANVRAEHRIAQEEIFGPVVSVMRFKTFEQALEIANGTTYGLSSSIYSKDLATNFQAIQDLEAGITYVNSPSIGAEVHLPFGGVKKTGSGHREAGKTALDIFSEWKTVYIDYSGRLQKAQVD